MSNHSDVNLLLVQWAGQQNQIVIPKVFCRYMGSLGAGAFLNQLIFWSDKGSDGWFYKTYEDWMEEIPISEHHIRKAIRFCEEQGFLKTKVQKANGNPTLHFYFDLNRFIDSIIEFLRNDSEKSTGTTPPILTNVPIDFSVSNKHINTTDDHNRSHPLTSFEGEGALPPATPSPQKPTPPEPLEATPTTKLHKSKTKVYKSRHFDKTKYDEETGYVRSGSGTTAVEVYYERFLVKDEDHHLTAPHEDDLVRMCPDLNRLREVIIAYSRTNYRPRNIKLILEWYTYGVPEKHQAMTQPAVYQNGHHSTNGNGRMSPSEKSMAAGDEFREMLKRHGKGDFLNG